MDNICERFLILDVGSDVGSDVGLDVGSDVGSDVRSVVRSVVGSDHFGHLGISFLTSLNQQPCEARADFCNCQRIAEKLTIESGQKLPKKYQHLPKDA